MAKLRDWADLAAWWDEKNGDTGDPWHRELIDPGLIALVGPVRGLRVLDLGCGNGYLARRFAREGARVTGVDSSAPIVTLAKRRERAEPLGITYHAHDAASLPMFADASFDLVFSNMVLMDLDDAAGAIGEAARVLVPEGRFVASLCHPCYDVPNASSWIWERKEYVTSVSRRVGRYRVPFAEPIDWKPDGVAEFRLMTYHRPLSWYARELWRAGLAITALDEPDMTERLRAESPQGSGVHEVPLHLVIESRKFGSPTPKRPPPWRRRSGPK
jgi:ubiquinone/menaquinone biosynthesis C-methylase UbiE